MKNGIFLKKSMLSISLSMVYIYIINAFIVHKTMFSSAKNIVLFALFNVLFTFASTKLFDFKKDKTVDNIRTFIENLPFLCFITDENYKFIIGNKPVCDTLKVNDYVNKNKILSEAIEKTSFETIQNENFSITRIKRPITVRKFVNFTDGRRIEYKVKKIPIFDKFNNIKGYMVFAQDIAEILDGGQKACFIPAIANRLEAPLAAQAQAINCVLNVKNENLTNEQKELLSLLLDSNNKLLDSLGMILSSYKYGTGDVSLNYERVSVSETVKNILDENILRLNSKNIKIVMNDSDENRLIGADRAQITKAIKNVIGSCVLNAKINSKLECKIQNQGTEKVFLSFAFRCAKEYASEISRIFDKKSACCDKLNKINTSFDIFYAKQIIEAHAGKFELSSKYDDLIIYNIELPANGREITQKPYCELNRDMLKNM